MEDQIKQLISSWTINSQLSYQEKSMLMLLLSQGLSNPGYKELIPIGTDRKQIKKIMNRLRDLKIIRFYGVKDYSISNNYVFLFKAVKVIIDKTEYDITGPFEIKPHYSYFKDKIKDRWDFRTKLIKRDQLKCTENTKK